MGVAFCYRWRILLAFLMPTVAALGLSLWLKPIYSANSEVLVRAGHEYMAPLSDVPHGDLTPPQTTMLETIDNEIAILTSTDLIRAIVQQVGATTLYPDLAKAPPPPMSRDTVAADRLSHDLSVTPVKLSNVIDISLRNADRDLAVSTLQRILKEFEQLHLAAFRRDRSSVLEEELGSDNNQLMRLEAEQASYMTSRRLFSFPEQRTSLLQQRAHDVGQMLTASLDRAALTKQLEYLRQALADEPETIMLGAGDQQTPMVAEARQRAEALREQVQGMLVTYRQQSSYVQPLLAKLRVAEDELAMVTRDRTKSSSVTRGPNPLVASLKQQIFTTEASLAPLNARVAILKEAIADDDQRLAALTDQGVGLEDLNRRVGQLTQATDTLRQRLVDARFLEELDKAGIASLKVIQQPAALTKPVFPQKTLFVLAGMFVGLLSSMLMLLLALTTGNRFLMLETVERVLASPVAVALPAIPRRQLRELKTLTADGSGARQIATNVS
jgi:uncharacterized protein involved in exopolysaccharide biosynthesis